MAAHLFQPPLDGWPSVSSSRSLYSGCPVLSALERGQKLKEKHKGAASLVCPGSTCSRATIFVMYHSHRAGPSVGLDYRLCGHKRKSPKCGFKRPLPSRSQGWDTRHWALTAGHSGIPETPEAPLRAAGRLETTFAKGEPWRYPLGRVVKSCERKILGRKVCFRIDRNVSTD